MTLPSFDNYEEASAFLDSTFAGSPEITQDLLAAPPNNNCGDYGNYGANIGGGGFLSSFYLSHYWGPSGVSNVTIWATGMPIGWSWNQIGVSYYEQTRGCAWGTITVGLQIGNITIGVIKNYHFTCNMTPNSCNIETTFGWGLCRR